MGFTPGASTPPSPSPSHQTASDHGIDAARAILIVGRQAMPRASRSCTMTNVEFAATECAAISRAVQLTGTDTATGLPVLVAASIRAKPRLNMNVWLCSMASTSQSAARPSCSFPEPPGNDLWPGGVVGPGVLVATGCAYDELLG